MCLAAIVSNIFVLQPYKNIGISLVNISIVEVARSICYFGFLKSLRTMNNNRSHHFFKILSEKLLIKFHWPYKILHKMLLYENILYTKIN